MSETVRTRLLEAHRPTLKRVYDCADVVSSGWNDDRPTDRTEVVPPFRALLRKESALEALAVAWAESLTYAGYELPARPVPNPPYVVVTSVGVVLRATVSEGRLVATLRAFDVSPYERVGVLPDGLVVERR